MTIFEKLTASRQTADPVLAMLEENNRQLENLTRKVRELNRQTEENLRETDAFISEIDALVESLGFQPSSQAINNGNINQYPVDPGAFIRTLEQKTGIRYRG